MSSRLRLQKKSAAKKEAELQVLQCSSLPATSCHSKGPGVHLLQAALQAQEDVEKAQFDSLQGAAPGTAGLLQRRCVLLNLLQMVVLHALVIFQTSHKYIPMLCIPLALC